MLGGVSDYLKKLEFKRGSDQYDVPYWPGLPISIMAYVRIWAPPPHFIISFSASLDKFEYATKTKKILWKIRLKRLRWLRERCDRDTITRIDAVKLFSKELAVESNWGTLFKPTDGLAPHNWMPHNLKPHASVPAYLPIVNSSWYPSGEYLRACPLDGLRFVILRPPEAEKIEHSARRVPKTRAGTLLIPTESSCAEWDGFLSIMSLSQYKEGAWC